MALNLKAPGIYKATRARPVHDGRLHSVSGSYTLPSGTTIDDNAVIRLFRIDPSKCLGLRMFVDVSTNADGHATAGSRTLDGRIGLLKSSNRSDTNISFTLDSDGNPTTTAATEDDDYYVASGTVPVIISAGTDLTDILQDGGAAWFNCLAASLDSRGYDANVMDVALTFTEPSAAATTANCVIAVTLEYIGVSKGPVAEVPYIYKDRYGGDATGSL